MGGSCAILRRFINLSCHLESNYEITYAENLKRFGRKRSRPFSRCYLCIHLNRLRESTINLGWSVPRPIFEPGTSEQKPKALPFRPAYSVSVEANNVQDT
jgi:hypothetical protein